MRLFLFLAQNRARRRDDLPPLRWSKRIARGARLHAEVMAEAGTIFHDVHLADEIGNVLGGENVGAGSSQRTLYRAFMRSQDHRDNVLRPEFRFCGIGLERANGSLYACVRFSS